MATLKVFFPGRRYGIDRSYLYFLDRYIDGDSIYLEDRYIDGDSIYLEYDKKRYEKDVIELEENIKEAYAYSIKILKDIDFKKYTEVIFIAKSIGTVVAGKIREELKVNNARFICLTPLNETLPYLKQTDFIITSKIDPFIDFSKIESIQNKFPFLTIYEDAPHSLEFKYDLKRTIYSLYENLELALNYLDTEE